MYIPIINSIRIEFNSATQLSSTIQLNSTIDGVRSKLPSAARL